jgi:branched-chain amino acid transport system ATP-binding protein
MADLLEVDNLAAGYGGASILEGISFSLAEGRSMALLGRNGTGKTTLINSLVGLTERSAGSIRLKGRDITLQRPDRRAMLGLGWVPQERNIFKSLTVEENLTVVARPGVWTLGRVYELFPALRERRANLGTQLSGGEQQLLAIGRALMLNPDLLLLDEPLEGLAPLVAELVLGIIRRLIRDEGMSIIVVEQHARRVLEITDQALVLERGRIVLHDDSESLLQRPDVIDAHLGVSGGAQAMTVPA